MNASNLEPKQIRAVVEAILMTADQPVTPGRLLALLKGLNGKDLRQAVDNLNECYEAGDHAMSIVEVAGGFQLTTRQEFGSWVRKFHDRGQVRLSQAGLETLAIVAFKQPVTRAEVDAVRGVDSSGVIRTLFELDMVRVVGRSDGIGKPMLFGTTREFMVHFGLKSLADLPKPKELEELLAEGARKHAAAAGTLPPGTDEDAAAVAAGGAGEEGGETGDLAAQHTLSGNGEGPSTGLPPGEDEQTTDEVSGVDELSETDEDETEEETPGSVEQT